MSITPPVNPADAAAGPLTGSPTQPTGTASPPAAEPGSGLGSVAPVDVQVNWKSEASKFALVIFGCCWLLATLWLVSSNSPSATGPYVEGPALLLTPTVSASSTDDNRLSPTWVVSRGTRLLTPTPTIPPTDPEANGR